MKSEKPAGRKRKAKAEGEQETPKKKQKLDKKGRSIKVAEPVERAKPRESPLRPARERLNDDLWMRVFEFAPPSFLKKARLVSRSWKAAIDQFDSIFVNCRKENFGFDMPEPPTGMTERQYGDLLGGKGCQEPGCINRQATRTYWSWSKRWCAECWERAIEREDRILKTHQNHFGRSTVVKMLESIPVAIHDSFVKPHDYTEEVEIRARGPPRLYKCYLDQDVKRIIAEYEALTPPAYQPDPTHTAAQAAAAQAAHKSLMDGLDDKRSEFFAAKKAANDLHMASVKKIEGAIRKKRAEERAPKDKARKARVALFSRRASEECPHIPMEFVKKCRPFKAACRIYRDGGTERGWRTLKPKIVRDWDTSDENPINCPADCLPNPLGGAMDDSNNVLDPVGGFDDGASPKVDKSTTQQLSRTASSIPGNALDHYPTLNFAGRSSSAMSDPARLSYNNAYCNRSFGYSNAQPNASLTQMARPTLPLPGQLPVGSGYGPPCTRSLPQPLGPFRPHPLQYHQPGFGMNNPYMSMANGQLPSLRTQIPIGSLLSTPATNQRSNPFE
ncbi:hypothetical protein BJ875DRAFT_505967 [Amylocarpus encephaloides]|uniref:F-box domain-containing protein n=1 Tax=Amylocarpus encephaloides TaxID=45428 RepID=A0A9P8C3V9_9HELO|nr:hypothetical protein BJ875DRAFT_505967 [Amylocarpus encephaloides]